MRYIIGIILFTVTASYAIELPSDLRDGDIIFQTSRSSQSIAIQRAKTTSLMYLKQHQLFVIRRLIHGSAAVREKGMSSKGLKRRQRVYPVPSLKKLQKSLRASRMI